MDGHVATALHYVSPPVGNKKSPTESSALQMVSQLLGQDLCLFNPLINGIRYEGCRENQHDSSRINISSGGIGTPDRPLTLQSKMSPEVFTLRKGEY